MKAIKIISSLILCVAVSGCIRTRSEIEEVADQKQVRSLQEEKATLQMQVNDVQADLRQTVGRIDLLERFIEESAQKKQQPEDEGTVSQKDRLKAYEESLASIEAQVKEMTIEVAALKKMVISGSGVSKSGTKVKSKKNHLSEAEALFAKKDWQKAILGFQNYREKYPKGKFYKVATYKIGVCFQELGMLSEAKSFFDEVIDRYSKSREARKSRKRLKTLRK